jgi:hypothetical protein
MSGSSPVAPQYTNRTGPVSLALGALALGALAIGAVAIGRLVVGRARIRHLEIDELVVRRLKVTDELAVPPKFVNET